MSEILKTVATLIKIDMLESLARHSNALWFGSHNEADCRWCQRYKDAQARSD
jgi:hypothetical protein